MHSWLCIRATCTLTTWQSRGRRRPSWREAPSEVPGQQRLPQGTRLEAVAHYDNSAFNPYNPDPTRTVPYGLQTYDEMFNGYGFYVSDDEDLNLTIDPKLGAVRR